MKDDTSIPDISIKIQTFINHLGISNNAFAKIVGTSSSRLSKILSGSVPGADFLQEIIKEYPKLNSAWLIAGHREMLLKESEDKDTDNPKQGKVLIVDRHSVSFYVKNQKRKNNLASLPTMTVPGMGEGAAFEIQGDSMEPFLFAGDFVIGTLLERGDWKMLRDDELYIVVTDDFGILIQAKTKYLRQNKSITFEPLNQAYPPFEIDITCVTEIWKAEKIITSKVRPPHTESSFEYRLSKLEERLDKFKPSKNSQN